MRQEITNKVEKYLEYKMEKESLVHYFRKIYEKSLQWEEYSIQLDLIIVIPFIHEFAYVRYTEAELREQVIVFYEILSGKRKYHYSAFFKLSAPKNEESRVNALYQKFPNIELEDLCDVFVTPMDNPLTWKDILYNMLVDILSKLDLSNLEESDFDYVNCSFEYVSYQNLRERIFKLLAYYLGREAFYVDVNVFSNGNTSYMIL